MTDIKLRLKKQNDDLKEKPLSKTAKSNTCKNGEEINDTGLLCTQIRGSPNKNRRLFLYVLCFRIINSFLVQTFYVPDEYWQCTEVAHKLVFGYGHMTWEWKNGLRSYSYPLIFAAYFYVLKLFKLDYSVLIIRGPIIIQSLIAAITDYAVYKMSINFSKSNGSNEKNCSDGGKNMIGCSDGISDMIGCWTLFFQLSNWFIFYTSTRTLTNSVECCLIALLLWNLAGGKRKKGGMENGEKNVMTLVAIANICVVMRTTSIIIITPVICWCFYDVIFHQHNHHQHHQLRHEFESFNTRWGKLKVLSSLVIRSAFVSLALQMLFSAIDSYMYGSFTFVQYNFFKFNVLHNVADFYGVHSWHWYLTEGLPVVLCTHIIFVVIGIFIIICKQSKSTDEMIDGGGVSECGSDGMFLFIIVWTVFIYSLLGHKEFRFMSGLLPIFMHVSGVTAYKLFQQPIIHKAMTSLNSSSSSSPSSSVTHRVGKLTHHLKGTLCKNLSVSLIVVPNIILGMYLSIIHQRGPLDVALYLSKHLDDRDSVLFLMPCHSTPFYSYIHKNVTMQFLTCEPNLNHAIHYVDEADWFFDSPSKWIEQYDWSTLKQNSNRTYIVMFDRLYERVRTDLLSKGFTRICGRFFHSHFPENRKSKYIFVLC